MKVPVALKAMWLTGAVNLVTSPSGIPSGNLLACTELVSVAVKNLSFCQQKSFIMNYYKLDVHLNSHAYILKNEKIKSALTETYTVCRHFSPVIIC